MRAMRLNGGAGKPTARLSDREAEATEPLGEGAAHPHPARQALLEALDDYRKGSKDVHEAAQEAGVGAWDLLEAAQATPDPIAEGVEPTKADLPTFIRRRE